MKTNWYFTFMIKQTKLKDRFVKFENMTYEEAREKMVEAIGDQFAFQYSEEKWKLTKQEERFGLKEIKLYDLIVKLQLL